MDAKHRLTKTDTLCRLSLRLHAKSTPNRKARGSNADFVAIQTPNVNLLGSSDIERCEVGVKVREAVMDDASEISLFLEQLASLGKRNIPSDPNFVRTNYIAHPDNIQCAVAEDDDGAILGLQILKVASKGNTYGVAVGWGIIGTHVKPDAARRGVGKTLFAATLKAAADAGLKKIDATIAATNADGISYYDAVGFQNYRASDDKVCKCFEITT
jgi:ribosomal protein S18 acetylase RimI-like enzyme